MLQFFPPLTKKDVKLLIGLAVGYAILATINITRLPIFVDEALYLRWAQIAWHDASWRFISLTDGKQPLFVWMVIPFMKFVSDPLLAGRLASAFSGLITASGMWYLGWLIKDKKTGYLAALLGILSPYLFFYNRFAVMEALLTAFGVWILNLSILLAKTRRLDLALLLGMTTGLGLLVKSQALFFFLLMPATYLLVLKKKNAFSRQTVRYLLLLAIAAALAQVINNIQRLSPWMHMIRDKNAFFTVPYSEIFKEPARLWNNVADVVRWHVRYTTLAPLAAGVVGAYAMIKNNARFAAVLLLWLLVPLVGSVAVARLFAPRYIAFATPFLLMLVAYLLAHLKKTHLKLALVIVLIMPVVLIAKLITNPSTFPFVDVDEGYINGWSAGNGVKEIAEYVVDRAARSDAKITVFTEGTFGILPHGLELYTDGQTDNLDIIGLYPIGNIPPERTTAQADLGETYLILNNTEVEGVPEGLDLIAQYNKARDTSMRLYQVRPTETE